MHIIGFTGSAGHGKSTGARIMGEHMQSRGTVHIKSFAGPLKQACAVIFGFNEEQLHGSLKENIDDFWGVSPRTVMQRVGTEMFREGLQTTIPHLRLDGQTVWIRCMERSLEEILTTEMSSGTQQVVIVDDVRFPDEAAVINKWGGVIIEVRRRVPPPTSASGHSSESGIGDDIPRIQVDNDGSMQEFQDQLIAKMERGV